MAIEHQDKFEPEEKEGGQEAKEPHAYLTELTFSDNKTIRLNPNEIVVFVGPNNSGKSQALKDIEQKFTNKDHQTNVVTDLVYGIDGTEAEMLAWLKKRSLHSPGPANQPGNESFKGFGYHVHLNQIRNVWGHESANGFQRLAQIFCRRLAAEERLRATNPPSNTNLLSEAPSHPIHYLQRDDRLEKKASSYFKKAFGKEIIVHRNAGNNVPLYIGERPILPKGKDRVSIEYIEAVEKLDRLETQGDGMKSFAGVILNVLMVNHSVTLLDEPEAFLHPPQARLLGKMIASEAPDSQQIFIATHSRDVLHGLMDANTNRVRVIRIKREGNINHVCELNNADIRELWNDPLLRYSNALSGLFHEHVVVCESDADCRFYQAIADALNSNQDDTRQPDILYIHCGGKQRIPQIISALTCLDIPISVIGDFDILNEEALLKEVIERIGGDWPALQSNWNIVKSNVENSKLELRTDDVKREINEVLNDATGDHFPKKKVQEIQKILKRSSPWSRLKETGVSGLPAGDATTAYNKLDQALKDIRIFVVPVGELEMFDKSIGNHGPKWVNDVLEKDLQNAPELEGARQFISEIYDGM